MKRPTADWRKTRENLNPKKMHEDAQMVRRVKAYLSQRSVIQEMGTCKDSIELKTKIEEIEDKLLQMSYKCEPDPHSSGSKSMTNHPSTTSIASTVS